MKRRRSERHAGITLIVLSLVLLVTCAWAAGDKAAGHPELSEQEMFISCAECHKEATPEIEKEWYDSVHGIAMVKCYQCHGTFEEWREASVMNCATCHADQLTKDQQGKNCWECHVPHNFKAEKE